MEFIKDCTVTPSLTHCYRLDAPLDCEKEKKKMSEQENFEDRCNSLYSIEM